MARLRRIIGFLYLYYCIFIILAAVWHRFVTALPAGIFSASYILLPLFGILLSVLWAVYSKKQQKLNAENSPLWSLACQLSLFMAMLHSLYIFAFVLLRLLAQLAWLDMLPWIGVYLLPGLEILVLIYCLYCDFRLYKTT